MSQKHASCVILFVMFASACNSRNSNTASLSPTAPTPAQPTAPGNGELIKGTVSDTAWRPLAGATVEVLDGPQAGTSTTADATGQFALTGTFEDTTRFRATMRDHVDATATLAPTCAACNPHRWVHLYLAVPERPVNMAGDYTLTFTADSACVGLPEEMRTRTYAAAITPSHPTNIALANTLFAVSLSGASFLPLHDSFPIAVAGDYATFWFADPALVEQVTADTQIELYGAAGASVGTSTVSRIAVSWEGSFEYSQTECESKNHQLTLTRR